MDSEELEIKKLNPACLKNFQELISLFREVFEMQHHAVTDETHLLKLLENPAFIALAVIHNEEVVGGLTAYELPMYYAESSEVFMYDIAIKPAYQRKGIGKLLLSALNGYCRNNGIKEFFVEAHETDEHAVDFYRSAGGNAEKVVHFNFEVN